VIALSGFDDDSYFINMVGAGANGFLSKNSVKEDVMEAIHSVSSGVPYYCSTVSDKLFGLAETSTHARHKKQPVFTVREIEVMQLVCKHLPLKKLQCSWKFPPEQ
jgi:DNA-binding NarL/FixJ family response regulator